MTHPDENCNRRDDRGWIRIVECGLMSRKDSSLASLGWFKVNMLPGGGLGKGDWGCE